MRRHGGPSVSAIFDSSRCFVDQTKQHTPKALSRRRSTIMSIKYPYANLCANSAPSTTPTHIHLSQQGCYNFYPFYIAGDDRLSGELRDRHTKVSNFELLCEMGLDSRRHNVLSPLVFGQETVVVGRICHIQLSPRERPCSSFVF